MIHKHRMVNFIYGVIIIDRKIKILSLLTGFLLSFPDTPAVLLHSADQNSILGAVAVCRCLPPPASAVPGLLSALRKNLRSVIQNSPLPPLQTNRPAHTAAINIDSQGIATANRRIKINFHGFLFLIQPPYPSCRIRSRISLVFSRNKSSLL